MLIKRKLKTLRAAPLLVLPLIYACEQSGVEEPSLPEGAVQHAVLLDEIAWHACPQTLPSGCEIAVLEGNPQASQLFTVRFRLSDDFVMPPHTHPNNERVTVLSGRLSVAFGMDGSRETAKQFGPGNFYVNASNAIHTVWVDELSELQITGLGPWRAQFVE